MFYTVLLVVHTLLVLFLIGIILLQRPEGDGLGSLGGGGGNLLSGRAAGNVMTRATAILATLFIITSLALAIMSGNMNRSSIVDAVPVDADEQAAPAARDKKPAAEKPADETPEVPKPE